MPGRPESPLDPSAGPVQQLAYELRKLRTQADSPTYRSMARLTGLGTSTLSQAAAGERLPTLPVVLAYARACGGDPKEWEQRWRQAAEEAAAEPRSEDDGAAPYRGLARFEPSDRDRFFGRDRLVGDLAELVRSKRFVAIVGASGSGKSSLLRAGLIPRLQTLPPLDQRPAALRILTPGEHPVVTHSETLVPKDADGDTVVVVDQFEEVFTLCTDAAERKTFIDLLLAACRTESRLRVVIGVRADFYGHCAEHRPLADALKDANLLVGPITAAELREAIVKPAQDAGLIVERELTAHIIDAVADEPGGLPLMSHALLETWRRRRGRALTMEAYRAAGGVHGAIARTAEDTYSSLTSEQAELARCVLLRLITPGQEAQDTRRPVERTELTTGDQDEDTTLVLERLARARLITLDESTVDLAHEALITAWPRLHAWIDSDRERLRIHRQLTEAARDWDELDRDAGALYRGARLAAAEEAFRTPDGRVGLTPLESEFLTAGTHRRVRERRRLRGLVGTLSVLVALALMAGVVAWQQNQINDQQSTEAAARRVAAVADSMRSSDPRKALQLSAAAWSLSHTPETRSAILGAMAQREDPTFTLHTDSDGLEYLSADGRTLVSLEMDRVVTWDVATRRKTGTFKSPDSPEWTNGVELTPDGRALLVPVDGRHIQLWDIHGERFRGPAFGPSFPDVLEAAAIHQTSAFNASGRLEAFSQNNRAEVWDIRRQRRVFQHALAPGNVVARLAVSPDGEFTAICPSEGGRLQLWDMTRNKEIASRWSSPVRCTGDEPLNFGGTDGRTLAVLKKDGLHRWEISSGKELRKLDQQSPVDFVVSKDGRFVASASADEIMLWRLDRPQSPVLRQSLDDEYSSDLSLDVISGKIRYVPYSGAMPEVVRTIDVGSATLSSWHEDPVQDAVFSADGHSLGLVWRSRLMHRFELWNGHDGTITSHVPDIPYTPTMMDGTQTDTSVELMSLSADGKTFAYGVGQDASPEDRIRVWNASRRGITTAFGPSRRQSALAGLGLSADGTKLVTSDRDNGITVWDVRRQAILRTLRYENNGAYDVGGDITGRPDGRILITGMDTLIADPSTGKKVHTALGGCSSCEFAFGPDGKYLALNDGSRTVKLWDGGLRQQLGVLSGDNTNGGRGKVEEVSAMAFSQDGGTLAVAGDRGTLQLWDVASRRPVGSPLPTPGDRILAAAFSADGSALYVAGEHVPWQKYEIEPGRTAKAVCRRAGGTLSRADWKTYIPEVPYRKVC